MQTTAWWICFDLDSCLEQGFGLNGLIGALPIILQFLRAVEGEWADSRVSFPGSEPTSLEPGDIRGKPQVLVDGVRHSGVEESVQSGRRSDPENPPARVSLTCRRKGPGSRTVPLVQRLMNHPSPFVGSVEMLGQDFVGLHVHLQKA